MEFGPHNMTNGSTPSPYVVTGSSFFSGFDPYHAFDGGSVPYAILTSGAFGSPVFVLELGPSATQVLFSYSIQANTIPEPARVSKDFSMQGSSDGATWTKIDTRTGQTSWGSGEARNFVPGSTPAA